MHWQSETHAVQPMGDESSTAQVHPQKLSQALMEAAQEKGAQLRIGEVQNITTSGKKVTGQSTFQKELISKPMTGLTYTWLHAQR